MLPSNSQAPSLLPFRLTSHDSSGVASSSSYILYSPSVEYAQDGTIQFAFTIQASQEPALSVASGVSSGVILAYGPQPSTNTSIAQHYDTAGFRISVADGTSTQVVDERKNLIVIHAVFMILAWLYLVPLGSMLAAPAIRVRLFKMDTASVPRHTLAHKAMMTLAVLFLAAAYAIGMRYISTDSDEARPHKILGDFILAILVAQVIGGIVRGFIDPKSKSTNAVYLTLKKYKNELSLGHRYQGRMLWVLAIANVFVGLQLENNPYGLWVAAVVGVCLGAAWLCAGAVISFFKKD